MVVQRRVNDYMRFCDTNEEYIWDGMGVFWEYRYIHIALLGSQFVVPSIRRSAAAVFGVGWEHCSIHSTATSLRADINIIK